MDNNINISNDNENIKNLLSKLGFDAYEIETTEILNAIDKANKIKNLIETQNKNISIEKNKHNYIDKYDEYNDINLSNENNFIYAAIPFLNEEYQKSIFVAIKLIELKKAFNMNIPSISLQSQSKKFEKNTYERRTELLNTIKQYMPKNEATKIDNIIKFIEIKRLVNTKGEHIYDRK